MQNYNSVDEESSLLGTNANPTPAPAPRSAISSRAAYAAISALALLGLGAFLSSNKSGAFNASTDFASTKAPLDSFKQSSEQLDIGVAIQPNTNTQWYKQQSGGDPNGNDIKKLGTWGDRRFPDCKQWGNQAINGFHFNRDVGTFDQKCSGSFDGRVSVSDGLSGLLNGQSTDSNGGQGLQNLDKQSVFCPNNQVLGKWWFANDGGGRLYIGFTCLQLSNVDSWRVTDEYTKWNDRGGAVFFLDRHWVECPAGSSVGGFEFINKQSQAHPKAGKAPGQEENDKQISIHYTCISGNVANAPTQFPTPAPTQPIFSTRQTDWTRSSNINWKENEGKVAQLAGFGIDCRGGNALTALHFDVKGDIGNWNFRCTSMATISNKFIFDYENGGVATDNGNIEFLDRQRVGPVGDFTYLSAIQFQRDNGKLRIRYWNVNYENQHGYRVTEERYTNWNQNKAQINNLDRHWIQCPEGWALRSFRGDTKGGDDSRGFRFGYTCATSDILNAPTPSPTLLPTPLPIALPTAAPSPVPISDPTTAPSPVPISSPTASPHSGWPLFQGALNWVSASGRGDVTATNILAFGTEGGFTANEWAAFPDCKNKNDKLYGTKAISGFHYNIGNSAGDQGGFFEYQCTAPLNFDWTPMESESFGQNKPQDTGDITFLDRQKVGRRPFETSNYFLYKFYFTAVGNQLQANWHTVSYGNTVSYTYADYFTKWNFKGDLVLYLDRHRVQCPERSALTFWEGLTNTAQTDNLVDRSKGIPVVKDVDYIPMKDTDFAIHYICGSAMINIIPSRKPVSLPTLRPISNPTTAPSPVPISTPTVAPAADPTESPIAEPTEAPVVPINPKVVAAHTCAFVFTKGVTPNVPPEGVVLIADKDINFLKPGQVTNAAYIAGSSVGLTGPDLEKYAILHKISTIVPGASTKATFYSGLFFTGVEYTFYPKLYQALTTFRNHGESKTANDQANSIYVSSDIDVALPSTCETFKRLKVMKD